MLADGSDTATPAVHRVLPFISMAYILLMPYLQESPVSLRDAISAPFLISSRALGVSTFYVFIAIVALTFTIRFFFLRSSKDDHGSYTAAGAALVVFFPVSACRVSLNLVFLFSLVSGGQQLSPFERIMFNAFESYFDLRGN